LEVRKGDESYGVNLLNKGWWKFCRGDGSGDSGSEMGGCDGIGDGSGGSASGIGGSGGIGDGSGGRGGGTSSMGGGRGRRGGGMASRGGERGSRGGGSKRGDRMAGSSSSGAKTITSIGLLTVKETSDTTEVSEDAQIDKRNASALVDKGKAPTTVEDKPAPKRKRGRPPSHVDGIRIYHKNRGRSERIANMKLKKLFQFEKYRTGSTPDKAFDVDD
ncbi:hypothetical protein Tco_1443947, partial [Tanacetum coccineum]